MLKRLCGFALRNLGSFSALERPKINAVELVKIWVATNFKAFNLICLSNGILHTIEIKIMGTQFQSLPLHAFESSRLDKNSRFEIKIFRL